MVLGKLMLTQNKSKPRSWQELTKKKKIKNKQDLTKKNQEKYIKNAYDFLVRNNYSLVIINHSLMRKSKNKSW